MSLLDYNPVSLAFGTSGLRGLVKDITDLEAYINVKGALAYLLTTGDIAAASTVVIAGDLRPSTERILCASMQAIIDIGLEVENAGKIPTPALMYRTISTKRAGVMVTGSHIPFDRNGIKVNKAAGEILKSDEPGILREVARVRAEEYARGTLWSASGMLKKAPALPPVDAAAEEAYVQRYLSSFPRGGLSGMRVVVYQHSAVGRDIVARILRELGADVVEAGRSETFIALDTESITDEQLARLEALADGAAIVSTDGDSDRPLVAAVVEGGVRFLPGDLLGIVVAEYLSADAVVVPISTNDAVERRMAERGVALEKTKIGSPFVVAAIAELRRQGSHKRIVGWEANGGFLLGSDFETLTALPTRDAMLPILATLFAAAREHISLSALWDRLPPRFGRSGLLDKVPVEVSRAVLAHLIPVSGEPEPEVVFATASAAWQPVRATLTSVFTKARGFGAPVRLNVLDGVRIYFDNNDVAHVRPSGNAPQLRIYANSDSQARADEIVNLGLREPDGMLRDLIKLTSK